MWDDAEQAEWRKSDAQNAQHARRARREDGTHTPPQAPRQTQGRLRSPAGRTTAATNAAAHRGSNGPGSGAAVGHGGQPKQAASGKSRGVGGARGANGANARSGGGGRGGGGRGGGTGRGRGSGRGRGRGQSNDGRRNHRPAAAGAASADVEHSAATSARRESFGSTTSRTTAAGAREGAWGEGDARMFGPKAVDMRDVLQPAMTETESRAVSKHIHISSCKEAWAFVCSSLRTVGALSRGTLLAPCPCAAARPRAQIPHLRACSSCRNGMGRRHGRRP